MRSYNGFSSAQRMAALNWLKGEYAANRRIRPTKCDACGQTGGIIEAHSEDYSAPYGDHIGEYGLCFLCHMILHCRFSNPDGWKRYSERVKAGWRWAPAHTRNFHGWVIPVLEGRIEPLEKHPMRRNCMYLQIA